MYSETVALVIKGKLLKDTGLAGQAFQVISIRIRELDAKILEKKKSPPVKTIEKNGDFITRQKDYLRELENLEDLMETNLKCFSGATGFDYKTVFAVLMYQGKSVVSLEDFNKNRVLN